MKKLPLVLSVFSVILGLGATIVILILVSQNDDARRQITALQKEIDQTLAKMKEDSPVLAARRSREKARNLEIEQVVDGHREALASMKEQLEQAKLDLEEFENAKKIAEGKLEKLGQTVDEKEAKLEEAKTKGMELSSQVPQLEQEVFELKDREQNLLTQAESINRKLNGYEEITEVWREHYRSIQKATRSYILERPWIEPGEKISLSFSSLDLGSGTMGLPVGSNEGLRRGMDFSLHDTGGEICKIRIIEVFMNRSLAMILPHYGEPQKLLEVNSFDLVNL